MEFPTDILSVIRDYAKPLPRRTISNHWNYVEYDYPDVTNDVEYMTYEVINRFRDWIINKSDAEITYFTRTWWEQNLKIYDWQDNRYTVICPTPLSWGYMTVEVSFTMEELMKWNGELSEKSEDELILKEDEDIAYQVYTTKWKTFKTMHDI